MGRQTKVTQKVVRGVLRDIYVDEKGIFYSMLDGDRVTGQTMEVLVTRLTQATAPERKNLNIKFCRLMYREKSGEKPQIWHGTITGKHATNNNMLIRFEETKGSQQESTFSFGRRRDENFLCVMSKADEAEILDAVLKEQEAKNRVEKLIHKHGNFDPVHLLKEALTKLGVKED